MPKLNDTQLVILGNAAKRTDGAILPISKRLKLDQEVASRLLGGLLKKKLVTEAPAENGTQAWRQDKEGRRMFLSITELGLEAIGNSARTICESWESSAAAARTVCGSGCTERQVGKARHRALFGS